MHDEKTLIAASLCAAVSLALALKWRRNRGRPPYPPGPKGYPLIGNILDLPKDIPIWQAFIPLARKFSKFSFCFFFSREIQLRILSIQDTDMLYLRLLTTDFVVLNSTEAITDLSEKRSNKYCDRVSPPVKPTSQSLPICMRKTSRTCRCSSCKP